MNIKNLNELLVELLGESDEAEWIEFKHNYADPRGIGEYISALANSATLCGRGMAYLLWGIEDGTRNVLGTTFKPSSEKVGNQGLELWLALQLHPRIDFRFFEFQHQGHFVVILAIKPINHMPVRFGDLEFIRVGSHKTRLRDHPEKEKQLWRISDQHKVELDIVSERRSGDDVLRLLDYPAYFQLSQLALPSDAAGILERLEKEKLITARGDGDYDITNLGALLFARDLADFDGAARKAVRVIIYKGKNRIQTIKERLWSSGYAAGFVGLVQYINEQLPSNEVLGQALRVERRMYPETAIRELVANAIIHQNLTVGGSSPMVEIFQDRIEITNPGTPLIHTLRFLDEPPRSRNEIMAALMRRLNICEERGSGIDKVVFHVEAFQLPAPEFMVTDDNTKATLYAHQAFKNMGKADKIRACYQHACLCWVSKEQMTNTSLRKRFGISDANYAIASRIIADTLAEGLVKPHDASSTSKRQARYDPFWA